MLCASVPAAAAEWSDTSLGIRYGTKFREPFNTQDITKTIVDLKYVGGYKYGTNFFNADLLMSDNKDPGGGIAGNPGAQEVYAVYRNTVHLSKVTGEKYKWGLVRDVGGTFGFDFNTKNDGYASKKRMFVIGPTVMLEVPGFLNIGLFLLDESNAPNGIPTRYHYKNHADLDFTWGIPIGSLPLAFEGFADFIASKGLNEFGGQTKPETLFSGRLMLDAGAVAGGPKDTFRVGFAYEWWKNKFGNDHNGPAGSGAFAKTPMIRAEYHF